MLQSISSPRREAASPPSPRCTTIKKRCYRLCLAVTCTKYSYKSSLTVHTQKAETLVAVKVAGLSARMDEAARGQRLCPMGPFIVPNSAKTSCGEYRRNIDRNRDIKVHILVSGPEGVRRVFLPSILWLIFMDSYPGICTPA
jgi:hypothetical protein